MADPGLTCDQINLGVPGSTKYLALIRQVVSSAAHRMGFEEDAVTKIVMAVDEACSNVIEHGYAGLGERERAKLKVDLDLLLRADRMTINITDCGRPFSLGNVEDKGLYEYFVKGEGRGLGVHIMKMFMDEVEHRPLPQGGNQLRLTKYLPNADQLG